jgi:hypothetical protein
MNKIEKLDLHLSQLIQNTNNRIKDDVEIKIGRINEYFSYTDNNPLSITVRKNNTDLFECDIFIDSQNKFDVHYINRIYKTPFYVSYLNDNNLSLKIVDFYEWHPETSIYRLIIVKKINYDLNAQTIKLSLGHNKNIRKDSENEVQINNATIKFSEKSKVEKNIVSLEKSIKPETIAFSCVINFAEKNNENCSLENVINKFHKLYAKCKSNHISNFFLTKNLNAEKELDELWNKQKVIFPDLKFDTNLSDDKNKQLVIKFWIKDFYEYFNIDNKLNEQNTFLVKEGKKKLNSLELLDNIPSKSDILRFYLYSDFQDIVAQKQIQQWWDVYSLPIFETAFNAKFKNDPEEVFAVYFLAISFKFPWAKILIEQIENSIISHANWPFHNFLFLLSFLYKRILRINNSKTVYSPGYFWDNNYKSIIGFKGKQLYEVTKFANIIYVKIAHGHEFKLKINKLCRISFEDKNNIISLCPFLNDNNNNLKSSKIVKISINGYIINFPLVWENGYLEFSFLKLKWILKKNRFQFTFDSSEKCKIYFNDESLNLVKEKKLIHYYSVSQSTPQICLALFNNRGGVNFSRFNKKDNSFIVSGYALSKYGVITNNILYSKNIRKQKLITNDSDSNDKNVIQFNDNIHKIDFYVKNFSQSITIPYLNVDFIDRFLNLNSFNSHRLIINIDKNFSKDIKIILDFFKDNFGFRPEYFIQNENTKSFLTSILDINFVHKKGTKNVEGYNFKTKNLFILKGENALDLLHKFKDLLNINIIK